MKKGRLIARAGRAERKRDTRRKILIGGAVLAAIAHEGVPMLRSNAELLRSLDAQLTRQHDRDVFELAPECAPAAKPGSAPYQRPGPQRSGGQGCRPLGGTAKRRAASLTAARAKGITSTGPNVAIRSARVSMRTASMC